MFRTPKSGRQHLSIPENTAPRRQEEESGYIQVCNKGSRQAEHQRSDIKLRNLAFLEKMQASGLPECIPFICTSATWSQILFPWSPWGVADGCFLHSPPPAPQQSPRRGDDICWITALGAVVHHKEGWAPKNRWPHTWRPEIADGCDISCLLLRQEIASFHTTTMVKVFVPRVSIYFLIQEILNVHYILALFLFFFQFTKLLHLFTPTVMVPVLVEKEFLDTRQKERRTKFIRGGGGQVATPTWGDFDTSEFSDPNGVSCNSILTLLRVGADLTV